MLAHLYLTLCLAAWMLHLCHAQTPWPQVRALTDLYASFKRPGQLNWSFGLDPCGEPDCRFSNIQASIIDDTGRLPRCNWQGIECKDWSIAIMDLSRNAISGPLPQSMANLSALQQFNAASNFFKGPLPDSWVAMRSLRSVVLSGNMLTGTLPSAWSDMLLQYLVLDNNRLMGWLPPSWGGMAFLRVLSLANNDLSGPVPPSWSQLSALSGLTLSGNCKLCGPPPKFQPRPGGVFLDIMTNTHIGDPCESVSCGSDSSYDIVVPVVIAAAVVGGALLIMIVLCLYVRMRLRARHAAAVAAEQAAQAAVLARVASQGGDPEQPRSATKWREYAKLVVHPDHHLAFGVIVKTAAVPAADDDISGKDSDTPAESPHRPTDSPRPTPPDAVPAPPHTQPSPPPAAPPRRADSVSSIAADAPAAVRRAMLPLVEVFRTASDRLLLSTPPETPNGPPPTRGSGLRRCTSCNPDSLQGEGSQHSLQEADPEVGEGGVQEPRREGSSSAEGGKA